MRHLLLVLFMLTTPVLAQERALSGAEISALLPTVIALGENTRQRFSAGGATTYSIGNRDTFGAWRVRGDLYCSQWPPARDWACYTVLVNETHTQLVWVDERGQRLVNRLIAKD